MVIAGGGIAALTGGLFSARLGHSTLGAGGRCARRAAAEDRADRGRARRSPTASRATSCARSPRSRPRRRAPSSSPDELESPRGDDGGWRVQRGRRSRAQGGDPRHRRRACASSACPARSACAAPASATARAATRRCCASKVAGGDRRRRLGLPGGADARGPARAGARPEPRDELTAQETYRARVASIPKIEVRHGVVVERDPRRLQGDRRAHGRRRGDRPRRRVRLRRPGARTARLPGAAGSRSTTTGRVPTDPTLRTELPGLFAAGIVRSGAAHQAAGSAGDGAAAAKAASRHLANGGAPDA